jgi:hypothetical protein
MSRPYYSVGERIGFAIGALALFACAAMLGWYTWFTCVMHFPGAHISLIEAFVAGIIALVAAFVFAIGLGYTYGAITGER